MLALWLFDLALISSPLTLVESRSDGSEYICDLASDGRELFYGVKGSDGDEIRAIPVGGGRPRRVVGAGWLAYLTVDDQFVYFTDWGLPESAIRRVPKQGGAVTTVDGHFPPNQPSLVGIDGDWLYFMVNYRLSRVSKRGGEPTTVAEWQEFHDVYVEGGALYHSGPGPGLSGPSLHRLGSKAPVLALPEKLLRLYLDDRYFYFVVECSSSYPDDRPSVHCLDRLPRGGGGRERMARIPDRKVLNNAWLATDRSAVYLLLTDYGVSRILRFAR